MKYKEGLGWKEIRVCQNLMSERMIIGIQVSATTCLEIAKEGSIS